jgi:GNAT superfamily N-acetyltransferase
MGTPQTQSNIRYLVSPSLTNAELNALFEAAWPHHAATEFEPVLNRSLAFLCAYSEERLVGFVNLAWDGGSHAFLLDTTVHPEYQRQGVGRELVAVAVKEATKRGVEWLHVDCEPHLWDFYDACGFVPTVAGLINLNAGENVAP